jgi:protein-S-isoprenylcysteine O-methyltransferase Ste14
MIWFLVYLALSAIFFCCEPRRQERAVYWWNTLEMSLTVLSGIGVPVVAFVQWWISPHEHYFFTHYAGGMLYIIGSWLAHFALEVNPYAVPTVEKPPRIVTEGVYQIFRHPLYAGQLLSSAGTFLLLGQMWAGLPLTLYYLLIFNRIRREDRILIQC